MASFPAYVCIEDLIPPTSITNFVNSLQLESSQEQDSKLYHRITRETVQDVSRRSSRKIEYRTPALFDWVQKNIVEALNAEATFTFFLLRNDLEVIRYREGDFFVRHKDHVNFGSNEFVNYTFLLNLQGCQEGGETLLYLDDSADGTPFKCTGQQPGSVLVFPKEMSHAGKKVEKGEKLVLMGNLLCFPSKPKPQLIISLTNGELVSIPVEQLSSIPRSTYATFVEFERRNNSMKTLFFYQEKEVSPVEVGYMLRDLATPSSLVKLDKRADFLGLRQVSPTITEFVKRINGPEKLLPTTLYNYYELLYNLPAELLGKLIPYQLITLELIGKKLIYWMGTGENRFLTCDRYCWELYSGDAPYNDNDFDPPGRDEKMDPVKLENYIKKELDKFLPKPPKLPLSIGDLFPDECFASAWEDNHEGTPRGIDLIRHRIFTFFGGCPMSEVYGIKKDDDEDYNMAMNMIQDGSTTSKEYDAAMKIILRDKKNYAHKEVVTLLQRGIGSLAAYNGDKIIEITTTNSRYRVVGEEKTPSRAATALPSTPSRAAAAFPTLKWEEVKSLLNVLLETTVVTTTNLVGMSTDHYCNESASYEVEVVCRFGFYKK